MWLMWRGIRNNNAVLMCRWLHVLSLLIHLCPANEISQELKDEDPHSSQEEFVDVEDNVDSEEDDSELYIVKHNNEAGQLSIKKGEKLKVLQKSENGDLCEVTNVKGEVGWTPTLYIAKLDNLEAKPWFHGNITRAEAELLLSSGIDGSFLVRESESEPGQFSISLRYDGHTFHYRIHTEAERKLFYVFPESKFYTVSELVAHHSKEPDGLPTTLRYPAPNSSKPPIYSTLHAPDQWEMSRSDIEIGQKVHEGQYSEVYKASLKRNQFSLAVKTLKVYTNTVYILRGWGNCVTHSCAYGFAYYYVFGKVCTAY